MSLSVQLWRMHLPPVVGGGNPEDVLGPAVAVSGNCAASVVLHSSGTALSSSSSTAWELHWAQQEKRGRKSSWMFWSHTFLWGLFLIALLRAVLQTETIVIGRTWDAPRNPRCCAVNTLAAHTSPLLNKAVTKGEWTKTILQKFYYKQSQRNKESWTWLHLQYICYLSRIKFG